MSEKIVHIMFRVVSFLISDESKKYNLLLIDRWILTLLAKHQGIKGIFPNQETIGKEAFISLRYAKTRIKYLESIGLISIKRINHKNHYFFNFLEDPQIPYLNSEGDLQITLAKTEGDPQITSKVIYRSLQTASTDHTKNKLNNKLSNTERARPKRAPLPLNWKPSQELQEKTRQVALKVNKSAQELITKFINLQRSKDKLSANWDAELENFLLNERPMQGMQGSSSPKPTTTPASMEWGRGHPSYDALHPEQKINGHLKHGELIDGHESRDRATGEASQSD